MRPRPATAMTPAETALLARYAAGRRCIELGSFLGHSALAMAETATEVWCVDHHQGDALLGPTDTLAQFRYYTRPVVDQLVTVVAPFARVLPALQSGYFGLVFVDDSHEYLDTLDNLQQAQRLLGAGGVIACHDWNLLTTRDAWANAGLGEPEDRVDTLVVTTVQVLR